MRYAYTLGLFFIVQLIAFGQDTSPNGDFDTDGVLNNVDHDQDNDGILNEFEYNYLDIVNLDGAIELDSFIYTIDSTIYRALSTKDFPERYVFNKVGTAEEIILGPFEYSDYTEITLGIGMVPKVDIPTKTKHCVVELLDSNLNVLQSTVWESQAFKQKDIIVESSVQFIETISSTFYLKIKDDSALADRMEYFLRSILITPSVYQDLDNDGLYNHFDEDADGDECLDMVESGSGERGPTLEDNPNFAGYSANGIANHLLNSNNRINYSLKQGFLDAKFNVCADSDNDGILDINDLDNDNDGVPDELEKTDVAVKVNSLLDEGFESFAPHASSSGQYNSYINNYGWVARKGSCDTWKGSQPYGLAAGAYPSPGGGVYAGCYNYVGFQESFSYDVSGLVPGKDYVISFYHMTPGYFGKNSGTAGWRVAFGNQVKLSSMRSYRDKWHLEELDFTATSSTQRLELGVTFDRSPDDETLHIYAVIDEIKIDEVVYQKQAADYDNDGIDNIYDLDSDNDGCPDQFEAGVTNVDTLQIIPGPYGNNGLVDKYEIDDSQNTNINYSDNYDAFAVDSTRNKCLECEGITNTACGFTIFGTVKSWCSDESISDFNNVKVSLLDEGYEVVQSTTSDSSGFYSFKAKPDYYFIKIGENLNVIPIEQEDLSNPNANHINELYTSELIHLNSNKTVNAIFDRSQEKPLIKGIPSKKEFNCGILFLDSIPYIYNDAGTIIKDSIIYETGSRVDSIKYTWVATNTCGLSSTVEHTIVAITPAIKATLDTVSSCISNSPFTVKFSDNRIIESVSWSSQQGTFSQPNSDRTSFSHTTSGSFPIQIKLQNEYGCIVTLDTMVTVNSPVLDFEVLGNTTYCEQDTIVLYPSNNPSSVSWIQPNGQEVSADSLIIPNTRLGFAGTYKMIVGIEGGCQDTINQAIRVNRSSLPKPTAPESVCKGTPLQFNVNGGSTTKYTWSYQDSVISREQSFELDPENISVGKHTFNLKVEPAQGCPGFAVLDVDILPALSIELPKDTTICMGEKYEFTFEGIKNTVQSGPNNFLNTTPSIELDNITTDQSGIYQYILESNEGCEHIDSFEITVLEDTEYQITDSILDCSGSQVQLTTSLQDTAGLWSLGDVQKYGKVITFEIPQNPSTVSYTPSLKCVNPKSLPLSKVTEIPNVFAQTVNQSCDSLGQIKLLSFSPNIIYQWQDLPTDSTVLTRNVPSGSYEVLITIDDCQFPRTIIVENECEEEENENDDSNDDNGEDDDNQIDDSNDDNDEDDDNQTDDPNDNNDEDDDNQTDDSNDDNDEGDDSQIDDSNDDNDEDDDSQIDDSNDNNDEDDDNQIDDSNDDNDEDDDNQTDDSNDNNDEDDDNQIDDSNDDNNEDDDNQIDDSNDDNDEDDDNQIDDSNDDNDEDDDNQTDNSNDDNDEDDDNQIDDSNDDNDEDDDNQIDDSNDDNDEDDDNQTDDSNDDNDEEEDNQTDDSNNNNDEDDDSQIDDSNDDNDEEEDNQTDDSNDNNDEDDDNQIDDSNDDNDTLQVNMLEGGFEFCLDIEKPITYINIICQSEQALKELNISSEGCIEMDGYTDNVVIHCYKTCYTDNTCDTLTVAFNPVIAPLNLKDDFWKGGVEELVPIDILKNDSSYNAYDSIRIQATDNLSTKLLLDNTIEIQNPSCGLDSIQYTVYKKEQAASAMAYINIDCEVRISNGISRNNDGINDTWKIWNIEEYPNNQVYIYNRNGNLIFSQKGYSNEWAWKGDFHDKTLPNGIYYYLIKLNNEANEMQSGYIILN